MSRKIPPFAAIRAFEAVVRLGRNVEAAQELNISASAVSHQIRSLEAFVGAPLLKRRVNQTAELTEEGKVIFEPVRQALDTLDATFARYTADKNDQSVSVHMFQSLANMWFIPKLPHLREAAPGITVNVVTMPEEISLSGSEVDMAIVFADKPPQDARCIKLFDEVIQPVCSPKYLAARGLVPQPEEMVSEPLIRSRHHANEWDRWFSAVGLSQASWKPIAEMDNRSNTLQAAHSGLGWAMDRRPFGEESRRKGQLVAPFEFSLPTGNAYYLLTSYRADGSRAVTQFRNWLLRICAREFPVS